MTDPKLIERETVTTGHARQNSMSREIASDRGDSTSAESRSTPGGGPIFDSSPPVRERSAARGAMQIARRAVG